jgi:S-DNA-T family DNA segregation ATPase FtsK/SpoIIIE
MINEPSLSGSSLLALGAGLLTLSIYPPAALYGFTVSMIGIIGLAYRLHTYSQFDVIFRNLKLGKEGAFPIKKRADKKDGYTLYEFTLPAGISTEDVERHKEAIQQRIGSEISISYGFKNILIRVYDDRMRHKYEYEPMYIDGSVSLPIGYGRTGKIITVNLSEGEPHLLIAGESGSGKSTILRAIITNLILTKKVDLFLIDLKRGAEFNLFRRCGKVKMFARTEKEALDLLRLASVEVDRRYDLFYEMDCKDIEQYNRAHEKLPYQVIVIDEFADLMHEKQSIRLLEGLSAKGRAAGMHIILSTQRPDAKVISSRIKANVPLVLGLKTNSDINSRIIIGESGLEQLRGAGHGILRHGVLDEVQCPFLSVERAQELLAPHRVSITPSKTKDKSPFSVLEGL